MVIIDLQIYNFLLVLVYNLQPSQTKKPIYNLQEIKENNCRFYNQYQAKSTIYKKSGPPNIIVNYIILEFQSPTSP